MLLNKGLSIAKRGLFADFLLHFNFYGYISINPL